LRSQLDNRCAGCEENFYGSSSQCLPCQTHTGNWLPHVCLISVFLLCGIVYAMNMCKIKDFLHAHFARITPRLWKTAWGVLKDHSKSIASKGKIAFSYYQVVLLMGQVYEARARDEASAKEVLGAAARTQGPAS
jgi:hypothetical protein